MSSGPRSSINDRPSAKELARNGFEAEPFGARSVAVKIAPAGVDAAAVEHMLHELLDQIWGHRRSATSLEVHLHNLRKKVAPLGIEILFKPPNQYALSSIIR